MPNTSSAKKALRQTVKRRALNRSQRAALRNVVKKCRVAAAGSDPSAALAAYQSAARALDKAVSKKLLHKNAAARTKSRLSRLLVKS